MRNLFNSLWRLLFLLLPIIQFSYCQPGKDLTIYFCSNSVYDDNSVKFITPLINTTTPIRFTKKTSHLSCEKGYKKEFDLYNFAHIYSNGFILFEKYYLSPEEYCIKRQDDKSIKFEVCQPNCEKSGHICIPKCCPIDQLSKTQPLEPEPGEDPEEYEGFVERYCETHPDGLTWTPKIYKSFYKEEPAQGVTLHFIRIEFNQDNEIHIAPYKGFHEADNGSEFKILQNGKIGIKSRPNESCFYDKNEYCLDGLILEEDQFKNGVDEHTVYSILEFEPKTLGIDGGNAINVAYAIFCVISAFFLLLTIIIYLLLWNTSMNTIHYLCIFSLSISHLFLYIFLASIHISRLHWDNKILVTGGCYFMAISYHFFFISSFCWLTVVSFNLFLSFRVLQVGNNARKHRRFAMYSGFGWGIPLLFVILSIILNNTYHQDLSHRSELILEEADKAWDGITEECLTVADLAGPEEEPPLPKYIPGYRQVSCLPSSKGLFMYYPAALLLIFNLGFFSTTAYNIYNAKKQASFATKNIKNRNKEDLILYIKLFFVCGIIWIFEIVSWLISGTGHANGAWVVTDGIVLLQGFVIFLIFVCKRDVLTSLCHKLPQLERILMNINYFKSILNPSQENPTQDTRDIPLTTLTNEHSSSN